jgi:hypothetical protein
MCQVTKIREENETTKRTVKTAIDVELRLIP